MHKTFTEVTKLQNPSFCKNKLCNLLWT